MDMALDSSILSQPRFVYGTKSLCLLRYSRRMKVSMKSLQETNRYPFQSTSNCAVSCGFRSFRSSTYQGNNLFVGRASLSPVDKDSESLNGKNGPLALNFEFVRKLVKHGIVLAAMVCGVLLYGCKRAFAVEGVVNAGYGVIGQSILLLKNAWPKTLQVLQVFKDQGLILAALLGLSAFFSMAETSITTLWPWKVCTSFSIWMPWKGMHIVSGASICMH